MNTNFEDNKSDRHLVEDDMDKKAKKMALRQMLMKHFSDGGKTEKETPGNPDTWHESNTAAIAHSLGIIPPTPPSGTTSLSDQDTQDNPLTNWNDPDSIKANALRLMNNTPSTNEENDSGYITYRKATPDYAEGGDVEPDDSDDDDDDDKSKVDFNLSDEDKDKLADYLDADKQREAKMNAIQQIAQITPEQVAKAQEMAMGTMGGVKDAFTETEPIMEKAANPVLQKLRGLIGGSVVATPEAIQAQKQVVNNLMETHGGAYWHPEVKAAIKKLNEMMGS